jgi:hypothetical protein
VRARLWSEVAVEESEITCEHNDHARIPTAHVGDCYRRRNLDIPNKNEKYETQAIPKQSKRDPFVLARLVSYLRRLELL